MARRRTHVPLNVFLNSRFVGQLTRAASGAVAFQYDTDWLAWEHTFPVSLSLPLREDAYTGNAVLNVFDNLLPDNPEMRRQIAARTRADGEDAYSLLARIGADCAGALQFLPEGAEPGPSGHIESMPISNVEVEQLLAELDTYPLGIGEDEAFRISLAGAQEKTALLAYENQWHKPIGSTATTHILKPQIGKRGSIDLTQSVENEYLCMRILELLGIPTASTQIIDFGQQRALVVSRFDRKQTADGRLIRVPQEDLCQALSVPSPRKYQSDGGPGIVDVLEFLKASDDPEADQRFFLKSQIMFWLLGANDGHAKNFSVFIHPGGGFRLTPLYDVMSIQPQMDENQIRRNQARMAMAQGRNRHYRIHEIQPRHLVQSAEIAGLPSAMVEHEMSEIADKVSELMHPIDTGLFDDDVPLSIVHAVSSGISHRLGIMQKSLSK
ncbi:MAG: type II toxin-antitoxin system HipA family toxin [Woeseia sp.]|jgi:serine/threonine-protein kinase HipA|nr:type II toxin-antitoxin system HipA family toxin [Woeseia sp.]MBT6209877.1 type II toxin-antitoxin system HipA family toxin [Woeseia sp.]